jgi:hypothetical protein
MWPQTLEEGAEILRKLFAVQFPKFTAEQWLGAARRTWKEQAGKLTLTYDPALAQTLGEFDSTHPLPSLWDEFGARAGAGHSRHQIRHSFSGDIECHARASSQPGID